MNVLSLESSGPAGSVAVLVDGRLCEAWSFSCPRGRGGELFPALEAAVARVGRADLVVVGTGPGGYNGLRMSVAAAWGVATAHGARLVGVPSLLGYGEPEYFVAGDARGGQWFLARVSQGRLVHAPVLIAPGEASALLDPGVPVFCPGGLAGLPDARCVPPSAQILALRTDSFGAPAPFYLKPPHITKPAKPSASVKHVPAVGKCLAAEYGR
ncbi:MAG: tRNA threonylcarbamoyladenosine biosynthesis protein TsaB [Verrucomicrobiae bacterium]